MRSPKPLLRANRAVVDPLGLVSGALTPVASRFDRRAPLISIHSTDHTWTCDTAGMHAYLASRPKQYRHRPTKT